MSLLLAISNTSQLCGRTNHARGSTLVDGTYDTDYFLISAATSHSSHETGTSRTQTADFGVPDTRDPTEAGYPGGTGVDAKAEPALVSEDVCRPPVNREAETRVPGKRKILSLRFKHDFCQEMEGRRRNQSSELILTQNIAFGKETIIRGRSGETANEKALQPKTGAVTIRDEVEGKSWLGKQRSFVFCLRPTIYRSADPRIIVVPTICNSHGHPARFITR